MNESNNVPRLRRETPSVMPSRGDGRGIPFRQSGIAV